MAAGPAPTRDRSRLTEDRQGSRVSGADRVRLGNVGLEGQPQAAALGEWALMRTGLCAAMCASLWCHPVAADETVTTKDGRVVTLHGDGTYSVDRRQSEEEFYIIPARVYLAAEMFEDSSDNLNVCLMIQRGKFRIVERIRSAYGASDFVVFYDSDDAGLSPDHSFPPCKDDTHVVVDEVQFSRFLWELQRTRLKNKYGSE